MGTLLQLRSLAEAEDYFDFFALAYDPAVLAAYRLHVLRRFALEMELIDRQHPVAPEAERLALYRAALARAHDLFTRSTPREEKLFRVHAPEERIVALGRRGG